MAIVILHTSLGEVTIELEHEKVPATCDNFISYVESGFYDNTIFHRVIDGFMIQGGGLTSDMQQKDTKEPIKNEAEAGLKNVKGTISMARTNDPHSATSQFFINVNDNDFLNFKNPTADGFGYCAFGKVIAGMDTVMQISHVNTVNRAGHQDVPDKEVYITKAELVNETVPVS